jgi:hypothetical protein
MKRRTIIDIINFVILNDDIKNTFIEYSCVTDLKRWNY